MHKTYNKPMDAPPKNNSIRLWLFDLNGHYIRKSKLWSDQFADFPAITFEYTLVSQKSTILLLPKLSDFKFVTKKI